MLIRSSNVYSALTSRAATLEEFCAALYIERNSTPSHATPKRPAHPLHRDKLPLATIFQTAEAFADLVEACRPIAIGKFLRTTRAALAETCGQTLAIKDRHSRSNEPATVHPGKPYTTEQSQERHEPILPTAVLAAVTPDIVRQVSTNTR